MCLSAPRRGVAGATEAGGGARRGVLADGSNGAGVSAVGAAGVMGSGRGGVTTGAGAVIRVARSS